MVVVGWLVMSKGATFQKQLRWCVSYGRIPTLFPEKMRLVNFCGWFFCWYDSDDQTYLIMLTPSFGTVTLLSAIFDVAHRKSHFFGMIPSLKLTWHLKINPWKRRFLLETIVFRCYVSFRECIFLSILNGPEQATFSNLRNDFSFDYHNMFQPMLESLQKITSLALLKDQKFWFFQFNTLMWYPHVCFRSFFQKSAWEFSTFPTKARQLHALCALQCLAFLPSRRKALPTLLPPSKWCKQLGRITENEWKKHLRNAQTAGNLEIQKESHVSSFLEFLSFWGV